MITRQITLSWRVGFGLVASFWVAARADAQIIVSTGATQNMSCSDDVCEPTAASAVLNVGDLENLLASGNLEITTTGSGVQANDIQIAEPFSCSSANSLTLDAYHSILFEESITVDGSGGASLVTNDGGSGGTLMFNSGGSLVFAGTANAVSINGQSYVLEDNLNALASAISRNPSGSFALAKNYRASRKTYKGSPIATTFSGSFNGLGNTISGLTIKSTDENVGLFAELGGGGSISSLIVSKVDIKIPQPIDSVIQAGAMVGENSGNLANDYATGRISARARGVLYLSGLTAVNFGTIQTSASDVSLKVVRGHFGVIAITGGIAGLNSGTLETSYETGAMDSQNMPNMASGGLVGENGGLIENCFATGSTTVSNTDAVGVGGLTGVANMAVIDSYSAGAVKAGNGSVVGGFVGDDASNGQFSNNYWDTTTSGITNLSQGAGNIANDPGITGDTTAQLQAGLPSGFDASIWAEDPSINNGLPYLIANPPRN